MSKEANFKNINPTATVSATGSFVFGDEVRVRYGDDLVMPVQSLPDTTPGLTEENAHLAMLRAEVTEGISRPFNILGDSVIFWPDERVAWYLGMPMNLSPNQYAFLSYLGRTPRVVHPYEQTLAAIQIATGTWPEREKLKSTPHALEMSPSQV